MLSCTKELVQLVDPEAGSEVTVEASRLALECADTRFSGEDGTLSFKSPGGKAIFDVNTDGDWTLACEGADWLVLEEDRSVDQFSVSCESNDNPEARTASLVIKAGRLEKTLTVRQNAYGTLEISADVNSFSFPAVGEMEAQIAVTSSYEDWEVETVACSWMMVERDGDKVLLTVDQNTALEDREIEFNLIAGKGSRKPAMEKIRVRQDRAVTLSTSAEVIPMAARQHASKTFDVATNFDWEFEFDGDHSWATVSRNENTIEISASNNENTEPRHFFLNITAGDGKVNVMTTRVSVYQSALATADAFVIIVEVGPQVPGMGSYGTDPLEAQLPFDLPSTCEIDWGDGTHQTITDDTYPTHLYTTADTYTISVLGEVTSLNSYNVGSRYQKQIKEVVSWGHTGLKSLKNAFYYCDNLKTIAGDDAESFVDVETFEKAFYECDSLKTIPANLFEYASKATSVSNCFTFCRNITAVPDGLLDGCPKLKDVSGLFIGTKISSLPGKLFAKTPLIENVQQLISSNDVITEIPADLFKGCSRITNMQSLFANDYALASIPEGLFDDVTENTTVSMMFYKTAISEIPQGIFKNMTKLTTANMAFGGTKIKRVPADLFAGNPGITTFNACFSGCSELEEIPADLFSNAGAYEKNTSFRYLFKDTAIREVPAGLFDGYQNVTTFECAFSGCRNLAVIPAGLFATNTSVTNVTNLFTDCESLTAIPEGVFSGLSKVTSFSGMFKGCSGIQTVGDNILSGCDAAVNISSMFQGCTSLTDVGANAFSGAAKIGNILGLFAQCTSLRSVPETLLSPMTEVTNASGVFADSGIESIPAGIFSANAKVVNFSKAFSGCTSLRSVPDGLFSNSPLVTTYISLFEGDTSLESVGKIFGENANTAATVEMSNLFTGCTSLQTVAQGIFDAVPNASKFESAFKGCTSLRTLPSGLFRFNDKATSAAQCFMGCTSLEAVPASLFGATAAMKTMTEIFSGCTSLKTLEPTAFSGVTTASATLQKAFQNCTGLEEICSNAVDCQSCTSYSYIFAGCTSLRKIGSNALNCTATTGVQFAFSGCTSLEEVPAGIFANPARITQMTSMFEGCTSLKRVAADAFAECIKATTISKMFYGCTSLQDVPVSVFDHNMAITTLPSLFEGCTSLRGESPYTEVDGVKYHLYQRTSENASVIGCSSITHSTSKVAYAFRGCAGLTDYMSIPSLWK